jgi:hypothetical protein
VSELNITVFCETHRSFEYDLEGFIEWCKDRMADVPAEFRESAWIEIAAQGMYDDPAEVEFSVGYTRPETPADVAAREAEAKRWRDEQAAAREREERATYERLKKRFGAT